jgi:hypothetical protein
MGVLRIVDRKIVTPTGCKVLGGTEVAPCQKTPRQDAQPPLPLVEPGALLGRKVAPMLRARIAQERPPLPAAAQVLGDHGHRTPLGDQTAEREAPRGSESIHPPGVALPSREWLDAVGQRRGAILPGAGLAPMPYDVPRGYDTRGDQGPDPMPDGRGLALLRCPRGHGLWGGLALQHRPAGLFLSAHADTPLYKAVESVEVEGTKIPRFGLTVWGMAVEPRDPALGFEVRLLQKTPETRTTQGPETPLLEGGAQVGKAPGRGRAVVRGGLPGGPRQHIQTRGGGQSAAVAPDAAPLAGH